MSEFGIPGFVAGTVRGTRAFQVDQMGRLMGVTYNQIWNSGENLAVCRAHEGDTFGFLANAYGILNAKMLYNSIYGNPKMVWGVHSDIIDEVLEEIQDHPLTSPDIKAAVEEKKRLEEEARARDTLDNCSHGFYAYYEGSNDYGDKGRINGVIEGYGETIVGTRGFRSMKARIVALHIPKHVPENIYKMVLRNYEDIPFFDSFKKMVSEFPSDDGGVGPTPKTDPDFWNRSVN